MKRKLEWKVKVVTEDRTQKDKQKKSIFSEEGRKKVSKLVGCWCERVEVS